MPDQLSVVAEELGDGKRVIVTFTPVAQDEEPDF